MNKLGTGCFKDSCMRFALAFALFMAITGSARADEPTKFDDGWIILLEQVNGLPWSKPLKVLPPFYPAKALASRTAGRVDIVATNDVFGKASVIRIEAEPAGQGFEEAVTTVFDAWDFDTETDDDCRPINQPHITRVLFEPGDGVPVIKVTRPQPKLANDGAFASLSNREEMSKELGRLIGGIRYRGKSNALVAIKVDGATGKALNAEVTAISGTGNLGLLVSALPRAYLKAEFKVPERFRDQVFMACHFHRVL